MRSLQRELAGEGTSFSRVVDELRLARARELLEDQRVKLIEVADELGYSDAAHLTRAFQRWTGMAPGAYRRRLAARAG